MPTYVYRCTRCDKRLAAFRSIDHRDTPPACDCGGQVVRVISAPSAHVQNPGGGRQGGWLKR